MPRAPRAISRRNCSLTHAPLLSTSPITSRPGARSPRPSRPSLIACFRRPIAGCSGRRPCRPAARCRRCAALSTSSCLLTSAAARRLRRFASFVRVTEWVWGEEEEQDQQQQEEEEGPPRRHQRRRRRPLLLHHPQSPRGTRTTRGPARRYPRIWVPSRRLSFHCSPPPPTRRRQRGSQRPGPPPRRPSRRLRPSARRRRHLQAPSALSPPSTAALEGLPLPAREGAHGEGAHGEGGAALEGLPQPAAPPHHRLRRRPPRRRRL